MRGPEGAARASGRPGSGQPRRRVVAPARAGAAGAPPPPPPPPPHTHTHMHHPTPTPHPTPPHPPTPRCGASSPTPPSRRTLGHCWRSKPPIGAGWHSWRTCWRSDRGGGREGGSCVMHLRLPHRHLPQAASTPPPLQRMMALDPDRRITPKEALRHPFIKARGGGRGGRGRRAPPNCAAQGQPPAWAAACPLANSPLPPAPLHAQEAAAPAAGAKPGAK